jgi:Zn-dependent oligopeptidase
LYARETLQIGAWADYIDVGWFGFLATDFRSPVSGAFLFCQEVARVFHEFGHISHLLLCEAKYNAFKASATPWGFVELPSQLFENFLWERISVREFSSIPDELFEQLWQTRFFQRAISIMRQLKYAKLDLELNLNYAKYVGRQLEELDRGTSCSLCGASID